MEARARELTAAHPSFGLAWKALSVALQMQGKEAFRALELAARLLPDDAEAQSNFGAALRRCGRLEESVACLRRALQMRPDLAEVWNNLGNAHRDLGALDAALDAFAEALRLKPGFARAHNNLGNALLDLGRLEEAMASYRRAVKYDPNYAEAHNNLGSALRLAGRADEAQTSCARALALQPDNPAAVALMAHLRSDRGQFAQARALLERAVALDARCAEAWAGLAGLRRMTRADGEWLEGAMRAAAGAVARDESRLRFAIGKFLDDVGDYEDAFDSYRRANELAKRQRPPHDRRLLTAGIDRLIATQTGEWLRRSAPWSSPSQLPVFVVGMPRSGTTLAEQILASHPQVHGAGELPYWNAAAERQAQWGAEAASSVGAAASGGASASGEAASSGGPPSNAVAALKGLADDYLALLQGLAPGAQRVIDKMPANFMFLGLIHAALPAARIIHLERHPIDTCLSIYFQDFGAIHSYANDLEDLAHYYRQYRRIMSHWRRTLPAAAMLDVPYEGLVAMPEEWSRRMVEFIGLPWDARCLEFKDTVRTVSTFSRWQARQPINRASVDRWRHYEKFVGPLRALLEQAPDGP
jgi:tetratricopeptide (TPR) repeat protein